MMIANNNSSPSGLPSLPPFTGPFSNFNDGAFDSDANDSLNESFGGDPHDSLNESIDDSVLESSMDGEGGMLEGGDDTDVSMEEEVQKVVVRDHKKGLEILAKYKSRRIQAEEQQKKAVQEGNRKFLFMRRRSGKKLCRKVIENSYLCGGGAEKSCAGR